MKNLEIALLRQCPPITVGAHPSTQFVTCAVDLIIWLAVKQSKWDKRWQLTSFIMDKSSSLMARYVKSCQMLLVVWTRKSENICVFPYFFAIGFILGINKGENSPFFLYLSSIANLFKKFPDTQVGYSACHECKFAKTTREQEMAMANNPTLSNIFVSQSPWQSLIK